MQTAPALLEDLADLIFGGQPYTPPGTWTMRLYTANPFTAGGTEITGATGYSAFGATNIPSTWNIVDGTASNALAFTFGAATASWPAVDSVVACNGTTPLMCADLAAPLLVSNGQTPTIPTGYLTFRPAGPGAGVIAEPLASALAAHVCGAVLWTPPGNWEIGLAATGEVSAVGYARRSVANSLTRFPAATAGGVKNMASAVRWPASGGAAAHWGDVSQVQFFDGVGDLCFIVTVNSRSVPAGGSFTLDAGPLLSWPV